MFDHCLYFNTSALARQLEREWAAAFQPFGLTPPQAFMLRAILEQPGMLQRELAQTLAIARPTATRALDGLAAKQLIERRCLQRDGRELEIHPTAQALAIKRALNEASGRVTARLKKVLGANEFAAVVDKVRDTRSAIE
ncbi:MarR family transcriptional regulator [Pandoraea thiooxydans]|uniref:MarR family transcriptional regulator n=1 Tax=Pandoraea thiooxydans TaxID=445709 RepID=A0A0G3ER99_9BURK|nr:MarR family transcriptional regulator [Pandoraea thiooxydans]AKJ69593.1 MarR family transcriptional regulator [Pandoraea thiooxydans]APR97294.1 MarR family transcriptional regulator [Pandoraea thiooxydans]